MNQLMVALIGLVIGVAGGFVGADLVRNAASQAEIVDEITVDGAGGSEPSDAVDEDAGPLVDGEDIPPPPPTSGDAVVASADGGSEVAELDGMTEVSTEAVEDEAPDAEPAAVAGDTDERAADVNGAAEATDAAEASGDETVTESAPVLLMIIGQVRDAETFQTRYVEALPAIYEAFGGEPLAAGGEVEALEGLAGFETYIVSRWPSRDAALAFWNSDAHEALRQARIDEAWGEFDTILLPANIVADETSTSTDDEPASDAEETSGTGSQ